MKIVIRYSFIYNKQFNPKFEEKDLFKLRRDCLEFEYIYNKNIKKLLKKIGKFKRKFIPIYIVKDKTSFSDPLTLKYKKDPKLMFITLAHELLHNSIQKKFKSKKELHKYMEPILNKIILSINKEFKPQLDQMNKLLKKIERIKK
ncbi:MAG: hypothetical protein ABH817_00165 [archaeon]